MFKYLHFETSIFLLQYISGVNMAVFFKLQIMILDRAYDERLKHDVLW